VLRFLLDEHLRGPLWSAVVRHNALGGLPVDAVRVGDAPDLPLGADDPTILLWAEREDRNLLTQDVSTMPSHLTLHLQSGHHSPGVFIVKRRCSIKDLVNCLELVAHAGDATDFANTITNVP
jgi:hypothetical protein